MPNDKQQPPAKAPDSEPESLDSLDGPASAAPAPDVEGESSEPAKPPETGTKGLRTRLSLFNNNLYLIVFAVVVLIGAAAVIVSLKTQKPSTATTKVSSLTDQQIASLKGNTTLVGDSKSTLDVQSNSIFEGQVLLRSDLNVAGALKIGGTLSLPAINVGGSGTFGQLGVSGGLNVAGDTSLQGQLTVQKNLSVSGSASFGNLSVSSLSVTSLQLSGDFNLSRHIVTSGGVPGKSNGSALGSGGTASVNGSDTAGTVAINTGGSPSAGCFITVNFSQKFGATPHVVISPSNSSAATIQYYATRSTGSFSICSASAPASGTVYDYDYAVID